MSPLNDRAGREVRRRVRASPGAQGHDRGARPGRCVTDISYFGTMMVHLGLADGMVSGAVNTTAHTIRPALEFVKTRPGVSTVSSVFLMCLADRVLVYGDCAVIPEPTTEQLADIAISSAETAQQFGIEPRVAMLSYSTGTSGSGADVEKVRAATALVSAARSCICCSRVRSSTTPRLIRRWRGPSCRTRAVAGRATVFIFPDLNTGNNTYKAVQRSAHAIAIGPVLQGLRKPVNDLSRGCAGVRHREHRGDHRRAGPGHEAVDTSGSSNSGESGMSEITGPGPQRRLVVAEVPARGAGDRGGAGQGYHRADRRAGQSGC